MATTQYSIFAVDSEGTEEHVASAKGKKDKALQLAQSYRDENKTAVVVKTEAGKVVAELKAPRKINMSKPYTRVVPVDQENVEHINGQRVAYKRTRVGFALLDASRGEYTIWDLERHVSMGTVEVKTTREAGRWFADEARAIRAELEAAQA